MGEPANLTEWNATPGRLFTCGRPGRATYGREKRRIGNDTLDLWVGGMPTSEVVHIVSLLGRKTTGPSDFVGRDKETRVFRRVKEEIATLLCDVQIFGPDSQLRFDRWGIDLVCGEGDCRIAVEGKHKIASDGAVPDNRKAASSELAEMLAGIEEIRKAAANDAPSRTRQAAGAAQGAGGATARPQAG